ncbi:MAG: hypothetical protein ACFB5Z_07990 [Elainellaceae cyanobacterium]
MNWNVGHSRSSSNGSVPLDADEDCALDRFTLLSGSQKPLRRSHLIAELRQVALD